jgi:hypothetical protein
LYEAKHHYLMRFATAVTPRLLCLFGAAAVIALIYPLLGLAVCCCCLIAYLKPDAPGLGVQASSSCAASASHAYSLHGECPLGIETTRSNAL